MQVNLRKLSEKEFDDKYYGITGFRSDNAYDIELTTENNSIGYVMVSNFNPHYDNECTFVEWVAINPKYQGKSFFSQVIKNLFDIYDTDEIHFECDDENLPMYYHMRAKFKGISHLTENNMMILFKEDYDRKNKERRENE